jgi:hypothetical protein
VLVGQDRLFSQANVRLFGISQEQREEMGKRGKEAKEREDAKLYYEKKIEAKKEADRASKALASSSSNEWSSSSSSSLFSYAFAATTTPRDAQAFHSDLFRVPSGDAWQRTAPSSRAEPLPDGI